MRYVIDVDGQQSMVEVNGTEVLIDGEAVEARLVATAGTPVDLLTVDGRTYRVTARRGERRGGYRITVNGHRFAVDALDERTRAIRDLTAASAPTGPSPVVAPMPGLVTRVSVQAGDRVHAGQGVAVMEAMKMENELRATAEATVKAVLVTPGTAVEKGTVLVELE